MHVDEMYQYRLGQAAANFLSGKSSIKSNLLGIKENAIKKID